MVTGKITPSVSDFCSTAKLADGTGFNPQGLVNVPLWDRGLKSEIEGC